MRFLTVARLRLAGYDGPMQIHFYPAKPFWQSGLVGALGCFWAALCLPQPSAEAASKALPRADLRLIDAGVINGSQMAGVEITMEPGVKTYWRMPGDSGLPPVFDWSASDNLADVQVEWPLPERIADPSGTILGYHNTIIFPVKIAPKDPKKPIMLVLHLDYAVCGDLCVPMTGTASLDFGKPPLNEGDVLKVKAHLAKVPSPSALGASLSPSLVSIAPDPSQHNALLVTTNAELSDLYVEGPIGWYFGDAKAQTPTLWRVIILERPRDASLATLPLTLTLISPERATETSVTLDASGAIR